MNQLFNSYLILTMKDSDIKINNIDDYIGCFPESTKVLLEQLRSVIHQAAPEAEETISYQMPAFKLNGILVYFAGYKNHIGFYPTGSGISAFAGEFSGYKTSKGTIQFPLNQPLPVNLITRIVRFRVEENLSKQKKPKK